MAKKIKTTTKQKAVTPHFDHGTVVPVPSMIVDAFGVAWWVDPLSKTIERAT